MGNNPIKYVDPDGRENWQPLTYRILWRQAFNSGNLTEGAIPSNNQLVGRSFENAVGQIFGLKKNSYQYPSLTRFAKVIPDFMAKNFVYKFSGEELRLDDIYLDGIFIEAKTSKVINLDGSTYNQMKAMVDACSKRVSIKGRISGEDGCALLFIVTPSDSVVSNDLIDYAKSKDVNLYHFTAVFDKDNPTRIGLSEGKLLTGNDGDKYYLQTFIYINGIGDLEF